MKVLVLNSGSSSLKYQVIDMDTEEMLVKGYFERIGQQNSFLTHKVEGVKRKFEKHVENHEQALEFIFTRLINKNYGVIKDLNELGGIGHRVVQGGEKYSKPTLITDEVIEEIKKCSDLAPLHNPAAVLGIEACKNIAPEIPIPQLKIRDAAKAVTMEIITNISLSASRTSPRPEYCRCSPVMLSPKKSLYTDQFPSELSIFPQKALIA